MLNAGAIWADSPNSVAHQLSLAVQAEGHGKAGTHAPLLSLEQMLPALEK